MTELNGRRIVVSGSQGRLGRAIVRHLVDSGATVVGLDIRVAEEDVGATLVSSVRTRGSLLHQPCDVRDESAVANIFRSLSSQGQSIHGLVNAHGVFPNSPIIETSGEEFTRVMNVNALGTMFTMREVMKIWIREGRGGSIVNLSSVAASSPRAGGAHYSASKAAVNALTEVAAIEGGPHRIRVNAIAPGLIMDEVFDSANVGRQHEYVRKTVDGTPLGRTGRPEDIAGLAGFLLSEAAGWMTGSIVNVSGGSHVGRAQMPVTYGTKL